MNTTFSFNRLSLLLKRFFVENSQKELTFWAISLVIFMLMQNPVGVGMFITISGFIFASRMFNSFGYTPGGMHYLLIPATHLEKLVTGILLSVFYFLICILACYFVGGTLGTHLGNLIFGTDNSIHFQLFENQSMMDSEYKNIAEIVNMFVSFVIVQSIFLLGSVYFKKNIIGKTMLAIIGLGVVLVILEVILFKLNFDVTNLKSQNINIQLLNPESMFPGSDIVGEIIKYATAPFLWVVSYFRLTEKEV